MSSQTKSTLLKSRVVEATSLSILKNDIATLVMDLRNKGRYSPDKDGIYLLAAAACYGDSYLSTGVFSESKGVLE